MKKKRRRIVLAGGSGLLGRALAHHFGEAGWEVVILTRSPATGVPSQDNHMREVAWDARHVGRWSQELEGAGAVVNLTGKSVNCRYNARNQREILDSRVDS